MSMQSAVSYQTDIRQVYLADHWYQSSPEGIINYRLNNSKPYSYCTVQYSTVVKRDGESLIHSEPTTTNLPNSSNL